MQERKPFCAKLSGLPCDPSHIAARPGEAGDETLLDRIAADAKHDRNCRGRSFCCK